MTEYLILTSNTDALRAAMNALNGTELVASQETFICWHWRNPAPADLSAAQALSGYLSIVQIA